MANPEAKLAGRPARMGVELQTKHLKLVPKTLEDARAQVAAMRAEEKAQCSADWLARVHAGTLDPWMYGYTIMDQSTDACIGHCGFTGPPTRDGRVEIGYGIAPEHQGKGYATEAAAAMTAHAFSVPEVRVVCAHTLPVANASVRVLTKCGFRHVGEVIDSVDGLVWRWEKERE